MKKRCFVMMAACLLCGTGAMAQDSIGADNFRYMDTAGSAAAAVAPEEETEDEADLETRIRNGKVLHTEWDNQVPGEWNDGAQTRLGIRQASPETVAALRKMKALQYRKSSTPPTDNWATRTMAWMLAHTKLLQTILLWLLGILLLAIIILFIRKNDIPVFRWGRQKDAEGETPDVFTGPQNYDALAQAAIAAGNLREAVRMRYLQSLELLLRRELIAPGKDKTNMDYLRELATTSWHKPFAALTLHYEYVWYGKLPLSAPQFAQLDEQFAAFKNSLSRNQ
ncbi:DUF4129 domain-containing protein [Chitinophaga lutea]|nr:DUF4129 domain-containing protein [Chitinophaga lutea]